MATIYGAARTGLAAALLLFAAPVSSATTTILMLGDSITAGYGLPPEEALPARLEAALKADGHDVRLLNAGVSGDTTAGGAARIDWALQDKPDAVIVELGANDALRAVDPAETRRNLETILARLQQARVKVLVTGMLAPRNLGPDYARRFDAIFPELAKAHGAALYPFLLEGVALDPKLNQPDGIHPNRAGVAELVKRLTPAVEAALLKP